MVTKVVPLRAQRFERCSSPGGFGGDAAVGGGPGEECGFGVGGGGGEQPVGEAGRGAEVGHDDEGGVGVDGEQLGSVVGEGDAGGFVGEVLVAVEVRFDDDGVAVGRAAQDGGAGAAADVDGVGQVGAERAGGVRQDGGDVGWHELFVPVTW